MDKVKQDLIDACALAAALRGEIGVGIQPDVDQNVDTPTDVIFSTVLEKRNEQSAVGKAFQKARLELVEVAKRYLGEST